MVNYIFSTEVGINNSEVAYAEENGLAINSDTIFIVEPCRKKDRKILTPAHIPIVQQEINSMQSAYPGKRILWLEQFKKGIKKSQTQIDVATKCTTFPGSHGVCLYEQDPQQDLVSFKADLPRLLSLSQGYKQFFVLEMESEDIRAKVLTLLQSEVRDIIFIAGLYKDDDLWYELITKVRIAGGEAIVILPVRMHIVTKKSYIEKAVINGASIVAHGALFGGTSKGKKLVPLFLDATDLTYKDRKILPTNALINTDVSFVNALSQHSSNRHGIYQVSRVSALNEGQIFCNANKLTVVI